MNSDNKAFLLLQCNIPVEKLDQPAFRSWAKKYIKGSGDLPSASQIRKEYVPRWAEIAKKQMKEALADKPVVIFCDETTDRMGRCVFAVLIGTLEGSVVQQLYLGSCSFLPTANATICTQAIVDTLKDLEIQYANVFSMCTDSAPYMKKCADCLTTIIGEHMVPFTCWAHKFNLLGEIWQTNLTDLNTVVAKVKNIFRNSRKLKNQYKDYLVQHYPELSPNLYPIPVLTRWASWFRSVVYLAQYLDAILSFIQNEDKKSAQAQLLLDFMTPATTDRVKIQAQFVSENCQLITEPILEFQTKEKPICHLLISRVESLKTKCNLIASGEFGVTVASMLLKLTVTQKAAIVSELKSCGLKTVTKINGMMASKNAKC